jgi:hypothetical protein
MYFFQVTYQSISRLGYVCYMTLLCLLLPLSVGLLFVLEGNKPVIFQKCHHPGFVRTQTDPSPLSVQKSRPQFREELCSSWLPSELVLRDLWGRSLQASSLLGRGKCGCRTGPLGWHINCLTLDF